MGLAKIKIQFTRGVKSRYVELLAAVTKQKRRKFEMAPTQRRRKKEGTILVVSLVVSEGKNVGHCACRLQDQF